MMILAKSFATLATSALLASSRCTAQKVCSSCIPTGHTERQDNLQLEPPSELNNGMYGQAVAVAENTILVGAPDFIHMGGTAYLYSPGTDSGAAPVAVLTGSMGGVYGKEVGTTDSFACVAGELTSGYVDVFAYENGAWNTNAVQTLNAEGDASADNFGKAIAIDSETMVIGGPSTTDSAADSRAYVYVYSEGEWKLSQTLSPADTGSTVDSYTAFGSSIDLDMTNGHLIIGSPSPNEWDVGAADVFQVGDDGMFYHAATLYPNSSQGPPGGTFGSSVAIGGAVAMVGAPSSNPAQINGQDVTYGATYVYELHGDSSGWGQVDILHESATVNFGASVTVDNCGNNAVVGAAGAELADGTIENGMVFLYVRTPSGAWAPNPQNANLPARSDYGPWDYNFGSACDMSGDTVVCMSPNIPAGNVAESNTYGNGYVFECAYGR
jgi:hypothetical protein